MVKGRASTASGAPLDARLRRASAALALCGLAFVVLVSAGPSIEGAAAIVRPSSSATTTQAKSTTTKPGSTTTTAGVTGSSGTTTTSSPSSTTTSTSTSSGSGPAPSTTTTSATVAPTATNCGGQPTLSSDGTNWACSFDAEFTGSSLDLTKWQTVQTATTGFVSGSGPYVCYVNRPDNVSVGDGALNLTVRKEAAPFTCGSGSGAFQTSYTGGFVTSYKLFSQAYGRFEIMAKVPGTSASGLQSSFWLYPESLNGYGAWPASGEIDVAETYSDYANLAVPYVHYLYDPTTTDAATHTNTVTATNCPIAVGQYNDYVLEWTPSAMTILVNGAVCLIDHWAPKSPLVAPQPFDQPFYVNLTAALGQQPNQLTASTPLPATTQVRYVRVWKIQP
ncbi:MAG TPA: glycoside hydrolase family 16 protein [Acidimicrobiales bacterium]|nr:glycoside hydrolase family 16 protein [Acidimicrobiales bacterium]